jgi:hypothetical protein
MSCVPSLRCNSTFLRRRAIGLVIALLLLFASSAVNGQTVDPHIAEFNPSVDHDAVLSTGESAVTRYDLGLYYSGASQPFQVMNIGKPVPEFDGKIRVDFVGYLTSWPLPGIAYEARVAAIGPNGRSDSSPSSLFSFSGPCVYVMTPTSGPFTAAGGAGSVDVLSGAGCLWGGSSSAAWVTVLTGAASGNGSLSFTVAPNTTASQRTAILTAGGASATVTQAGGSCSFAVSPTSVSAPAGGATGTLGVTTLSGCNWTAASAVSWVTLTGGGAGSGTGSVGYTVAANTSTSPRTGTVTVAGTVVTVTQAGVDCTFTLSAGSVSFPKNGGNSYVSVTTSSACGWTATSNAAWITVAGATAGRQGNGTVTFTVTKTSVARTGTLTVAGKSVTITQNR